MGSSKGHIEAPSPQTRDIMADEIKIDKQLFQDRLAHFVSAWKADKRAGDASFGGVGSIVVLLGKTEENSMFSKGNAVHVSGIRPCLCL